jgi:hypothetical protein
LIDGSCAPEALLPLVAVNPRGVAVVVFAQRRAWRCGARPLESFVVLAIATNGPGDIILGWERWTASAGTSARAAFRPADGHWRSPKLLATGNWTTPAVGIARNGHAVALWTTPEAVQARLRRDTTAP